MLATALAALGMLAGLSILLSDTPRTIAWPAVIVACAWGASLARIEMRRAAIEIVIAPSAERGAMPTAHVDGHACAVSRLRWRGPIAFLDLVDAGHVRRVVFWPDLLDAPSRRELRLIVPMTPAAAGRRSMAP